MLGHRIRPVCIKDFGFGLRKGTGSPKSDLKGVTLPRIKVKQTNKIKCCHESSPQDTKLPKVIIIQSYLTGCKSFFFFCDVLPCHICPILFFFLGGGFN